MAGVAFVTSTANYGSTGQAAPYDIKGIYGLASYNTAGAAPTNDTPAEEVGYSFLCMDDGDVTEGITISLDVQKCAKVFVNITNGTAAPAMITDPAHAVTAWEAICVACKPGFKAIRNENFPDVVTGCSTEDPAVKITNCASGVDWEGMCSACDNLFTFEFNSVDNYIDFTSCIS